MGKRWVLFVGSFKEQSKDGSVGGQMYACRSLINSELSNSFEWILIDSTADSNKPENLIKRIYKASIRIIKFIFYLSSRKIDVVLIFSADGWSFLEKGTMALLAKLFNKRVVFAPRSGLIVNDIRESIFLRKFIPFVLNYVDYIICQGDVWKHFYSNLVKINFDKLIVINNWIETEKYNSTSLENKDYINILYLAWVDENKGVFDLINCLKYLNNKNYFLNIAGDGRAMDECKKLINILGLSDKINILGWVLNQDKIELLSKSDIFVLPSYFEGYPNSLIEAMASSCAVITTDVGSIPDLIKHKTNGLIFNPGNIFELANYIDLLISNPDFRMQLASCGRKSVELNNSISIAVEKFKRVLN
jgi:glycosyltransferase involved in cell wall biosynthesis